ncbi:mitochondrial import protein Pam17 [Gorgonomyces haynaldii]|nr:mitochondrial import protein Pam17 [Gorgonomyces haynaldii]
MSQLNWKDFFLLRKSRLQWERSAGLLGTLSGFGVGGAYFLFVADFDPLAEGPFGLPDMGMAYGLGIVLSGFGGFVLGTLGAVPMWRILRKPNILKMMDVKERDLYQRISKHRPKDIPFMNVPGSQRAVRLPDYYGEKITSVSAYRTWMRNQKLFMARLKSGRLEVD